MTATTIHGLFTCAACGETFTKSWSDEEADAEGRAVFGRETAHDPAAVTVCANCYRFLKDTYPPNKGPNR